MFNSNVTFTNISSINNNNNNNNNNMKSSKYKLIKQNMEYLKQQTHLNNETNKKTRLILNNLKNKNNNESLSQLNKIFSTNTSFNKKYSNNNSRSHCETGKLSKINTDLINYVKSREKFIQHANYWQQIWLFTDNPIFEYENSIGFENPTYNYLNAKEEKLNSEISIDATVMNIYESILDLNQTTKPSSLMSSSASIGINNQCELESICSPNSNDSGIHSDNHLIRHTIQSSQMNSNVDDLMSERTNSINGEDSLYSSVISSKKSFTRDLSSYSKLDSVDDDVSTDDFKHVEQHELPLGWIRCCDENGIYYWHKPSGTVTRKPPSLTKSSLIQSPPEKKFNINEYISLNNNNINSVSTTTNNKSSLASSSASSTTSSCSNNHLIDADYESDDAHLKTTESTMNTSTYSSKSKLETPIKIETKRFYVRSLGWVRIDENDLTPERSSKAVNKCINDLSRGIKDINDVVARWGEGKDLYMDFDDTYLVLKDPTDDNILNRQAITSIRVWGVGRDNGRDFAYVARDKQSKIHMCHVFRCDSAPAKEIANYLRDTCRRIINEKKQELTGVNLLKRPNFLPDLSNPKFNPRNKSLSYNDQQELKKNLYESNQTKMEFLSPSDEPKKSIRCRYLGNTLVDKPSGMDVLNDAIEKIYMKALDDYKRLLKQQKSKNYNLNHHNNNNNNNTNLEDEDEEINNDEYDYDNMFSFNLLDLNGEKDLGLNVDVSISPSTIEIKRVNYDESLLECRVRYLSFMGISIDARLCGFIMHCADNTFRCHAFLCENSSGQLCKTIEAACKLRYAKCLDAHPDMSNEQSNTDSSKLNSTNTSVRFGFLGSQLKNMFDSFRTKTLFMSSNSSSSPLSSYSSSSSK